MSLDAIRAELQVAIHDHQELSAYIIMYRYVRITSWHSSRCRRCEQHTFLTLHLHQYPFRPDRSAKELFASSSFEILDGFCTICGNDDLWKRLCRIDPTRDAARSAFDPYSHKDQMCPACLANAFNGIIRGGIWSGACDDCHVLFASQAVRKRVRQNLAVVSRLRRELRFRIWRLKREAECYAASAPYLDDADVKTLPPPSSR